MEEYVEEICIVEDKEIAIDEIMRVYGQDVLHLVYSYVKDPSIAEDLTQEIFVKCYKNLHTYKRNSKLKTWVWRIAINHCKDYLKSWYKRKVIPAEEQINIVSSNEDVEEFLIQQEADGELVDAVMGLPLKYREVIYLFYFEEMPMKEISGVTGQKINTVKTRLRKAKEQLRAKLGGEL
ncbi:sigma-70 family RNA polymerase sigma factor [Guptibacillus algicola]|uniref:sigma-70 family RNA polymerase sigma factor n=1 Tax=Guptibacillus algicola TaxID=225844 RepID=UPI001CD4EF29|nr:sigma-70 family RNA polymerase sigma factor [Alkalihalobacillus algicola]MCA0987249.1 sigma-70 family RNA polymerase sigma factor [Alkalihalobacillus algicola]